jgi:hypothetical protein
MRRIRVIPLHLLNFVMLRLCELSDVVFVYLAHLSDDSDNMVELLGQCVRNVCLPEHIDNVIESAGQFGKFLYIMLLN